jgi:hypothetical protein
MGHLPTVSGKNQHTVSHAARIADEGEKAWLASKRSDFRHALHSSIASGANYPSGRKHYVLPLGLRLFHRRNAHICQPLRRLADAAVEEIWEQCSGPVTVAGPYRNKSLRFHCLSDNGTHGLPIELTG